MNYLKEISWVMFGLLIATGFGILIGFPLAFLLDGVLKYSSDDWWILIILGLIIAALTYSKK